MAQPTKTNHKDDLGGAGEAGSSPDRKGFAECQVASMKSWIVSPAMWSERNAMSLRKSASSGPSGGCGSGGEDNERPVGHGVKVAKAGELWPDSGRTAARNRGQRCQLMRAA